METTILKRGSSSKRVAREKMLVDIPQTDLLFFQQFAEKMGWLVLNKQRLWDNYAKSAPKNVELTDEEIMAEVKAVRYGEL
jgi:hypothetical protein